MTGDLGHHKRIRELNDAFRLSGRGGRVMMTRGIAALPTPTQVEIVRRVRHFDKFGPDNDPYHEHEYGSIELPGRRVLWKIDYYNKTLDAGSEDPADPAQTTRVLTIMLAEEY